AIWLPECAYRPRYEWPPPAGQNRGDRRLRPGIEEMLAEYNLEYFIADAHLIAAAAPVFLYRDYLPRKVLIEAAGPDISRKAPLSPYQPYRVASRGGTGTAVAFFRDPKTTLQVWSREHGYPGEYAYLEFHKKHFPGGLRFWRITDSSGDLGKKIVYDPALAAEKVRSQARHFVELVGDTLGHASTQGPAGDAKGDLRRVLAQTTRELLRLESSDWQFLITTQAARDYAERRVAEHYAEFKRLSEMARSLEDGNVLSAEAGEMLSRLERQ